MLSDVGSYQEAALHSFSYDPAASAIFSAFSTPPSTDRKKIINDLVVALKTSGIWNNLDLMYLIAAADSQAASINWINPGTFTFSLVNTPTFVADQGYAGNETNQALDTGWTPSTQAVNYTLNNASVWTYSRTSTLSTRTDIGSTNSYFATRWTGDVFIGRINDATNDSKSNTNGSGMFGIQRTSPTAKVFWRNGVTLGTSTRASTSVPSNTQYICGSNGLNDGGKQMAFAAWGSSLSGKEAVFYSSVLNYMQAIGAA